MQTGRSYYPEDKLPLARLIALVLNLIMPPAKQV